jgi:hypothetical protein
LDKYLKQGRDWFKYLRIILHFLPAALTFWAKALLTSGIVTAAVIRILTNITNFIVPLWQNLSGSLEKGGK